MEYISIGMVRKKSTEQIVNIEHNGQMFCLTGREAAIWINGRFEFCKVEDPIGLKGLKHLSRMGLVITVDEEVHGRYWALTKPLFCATESRQFFAVLSRKEKFVLNWLCSAGMHLSLAELVFLAEHRIEPCDELIGVDNRQNLTEKIYSRETIFDNLLELAMENTASADWVVEALLKLIRKKKAVLI